jgi:copper chaperone
MARLQEIIIDVAGMTCEHCERRVATALEAVSGVVRAQASHSENRAVVTADPNAATPDALKSAIAGAGYEAGEVSMPE